MSVIETPGTPDEQATQILKVVERFDLDVAYPGFVQGRAPSTEPSVPESPTDSWREGTADIVPRAFDTASHTGDIRASGALLGQSELGLFPTVPLPTDVFHFSDHREKYIFAQLSEPSGGHIGESAWSIHNQQAVTTGWEELDGSTESLMAIDQTRVGLSWTMERDF
jgi:hypothetical protein